MNTLFTIAFMICQAHGHRINRGERGIGRASAEIADVGVENAGASLAEVGHLSSGRSSSKALASLLLSASGNAAFWPFSRAKEPEDPLAMPKSYIDDQKALDKVMDELRQDPRWQEMEETVAKEIEALAKDPTNEGAKERIEKIYDGIKSDPVLLKKVEFAGKQMEKLEKQFMERMKDPRVVEAIQKQVAEQMKDPAVIKKIEEEIKQIKDPEQKKKTEEWLQRNRQDAGHELVEDEGSEVD